MVRDREPWSMANYFHFYLEPNAVCIYLMLKLGSGSVGDGYHINPFAKFLRKIPFFYWRFRFSRCLPELHFIKARREGDQMQPFLVRAFRKNCKNNCLYQLVSEIEIFVNENHVNWILLYWLCDWQWSPAKKQVALTITLVHLSKRLRKLFILAFT